MLYLPSVTACTFYSSNFASVGKPVPGVDKPYLLFFFFSLSLSLSLFPPSLFFSSFFLLLFCLFLFFLASAVSTTLPYCWLNQPGRASDLRWKCAPPSYAGARGFRCTLVRAARLVCTRLLRRNDDQFTKELRSALVRRFRVYIPAQKASIGIGVSKKITIPLNMTNIYIYV